MQVNQVGTTEIPVVLQIPAGMMDGGGETVAELKALVTELRDLVKDAEPVFWTEKELADKWGCALITLQRKRRAGRIKYKRIGNEVIYSRKHIEDFLNSEK